MDKIFIVLLVISSIVIILATLMMEPKTQGAGSLYGMETNTFGTASHQSKDYLLTRATIVCSVLFVISLIGLVAL